MYVRVQVFVYEDMVSVCARAYTHTNRHTHTHTCRLMDTYVLCICTYVTYIELDTYVLCVCTHVTYIENIQ